MQQRARADDRKAAGLCAEELAKQEISAPSKAALMIGDEASAAQ
jgi:hypothetical protein